MMKYLYWIVNIKKCVILIIEMLMLRRIQSTWPTLFGKPNCMCCMWLVVALTSMDVIENIFSSCCDLSSPIVVLLHMGGGGTNKHNFLPNSMQHLHMSPKVYAINIGQNDANITVVLVKLLLDRIIYIQILCHINFFITYCQYPLYTLNH